MFRTTSLRDLSSSRATFAHLTTTGTESRGSRDHKNAQTRNFVSPEAVVFSVGSLLGSLALPLSGQARSPLFKENLKNLHQYHSCLFTLHVSALPRYTPSLCIGKPLIIIPERVRSDFSRCRISWGCCEGGWQAELSALSAHALYFVYVNNRR